MSDGVDEDYMAMLLLFQEWCADRGKQMLFSLNIDSDKTGPLDVKAQDRN